jgi:hypothetical protein
MHLPAPRSTSRGSFRAADCFGDGAVPSARPMSQAPITVTANITEADTTTLEAVLMVLEPH